MRQLFLSFALVGILAACGEPPSSGPTPSLEEARQAEQSSERDKPLSDTSLTKIVREALQSESSLDARRIDVENRDGTILLHGQVESEEQREKAGRIVGSVGGVVAVENQLTVSPSASTGGTMTGEPLFKDKGEAPALPK